MEAELTAREWRRARAAPDLGIVDGLVQLSFLVQSVLAQVAAGDDLTLLQSRLLGVLRDRQPSMAQLARLLGLDKSSTTGLVDRAERRGLVRRVEVPEDGRAVRVTLTAEGRRLVEVLGAEMGRQITELTDGLSDTNRRRLSLLAGRIVIRHADAVGLDLSTSASSCPADPPTPPEKETPP
jgi:DNA-binding MarR family transcriptional regulator